MATDDPKWKMSGRGEFVGGRRTGGCIAGWLLAACVIASGMVGSAEAALTLPDSIVYGRVFLNGQPLEDAVVSARVGDLILDRHVIGSLSTAPDLFGLAIGVGQTTATGETLPANLRPEGSSVRLFVDERYVGDMAVRSGIVVRQDISAGQALCSGGAADGMTCTSDDDCPGGVCVGAKPLCDGGGRDGEICQCIGGSCSNDVACSQSPAMGTCTGGLSAGDCCSVEMNCTDGAACVGSQKLCAGGARKGQPCLRNDQCPGSQCVSTGFVCNGGDNAGYPCVDGADCPGGGICGERIATATPTPTVTATPTRTLPGGDTPVVTATPTPTATTIVSGCAGDCDGSGTVSIAELIRLVNIALGQQSLDVCTVGDINGDGRITINELITAVNRALGGCGG